ncbi:MAG: CBS domain-containing protein [Pseudomonadota bacterium]
MSGGNGLQQDKRVYQIMTDELVMVGIATPLATAALRMETQAVSSILIEEAGRPVGIITERDVMRALADGMGGDEPVGRLMTRGLISVRQDEQVHAAFHLMVINAIRHLVVVDEQGNAVGILSETDFRKYRGVENFVTALDVGRAMSQSYVQAAAEDALREVAQRMQEQRVGCAIVVAQGRPQGVVTERDMVRLFRAGQGGQCMQAVMHAPVAGVPPDMLLVDAVRQMQQKGVRRLAVVDGEGRLLGVINEHDVVRHLEDEYVQMLQELVLQQAQALNQDKFRAVVDTVPDKIMLKDVNSVYVSCNASYAADLGIAPDQIVGKSDFDFFPPQLAEKYQADDRAVMQEGKPRTFEEPYLKDGLQGWIRTTKSPMRNEHGAVTGVVVVFHDITAQRQSYDLLKQRTWALETLSACNKAMLVARTEEEMWHQVCAAITANARYPLVCVGRCVGDARPELMLQAFAGPAQAALRGWRFSCAEGESAGNPFIRSLLRAESQCVPDMAQEAWAQPFLVQGLRACVVLPIRQEAAVGGVLALFSNEAGELAADMMDLLRELVDNISHAAAVLRHKLDYLIALEQQRVQSLKLERSLEDALMAIASTLEQRDPYTAGHQKHVAELAVLIGKQMGLADDALKALSLAAIVHDIGKIQIPAQILTKPGRLNQAEFALVKSHPAVGYNILKNIDFPWPIADIVYQHHEYLDGSGYPRGLRGEQIMLEARILTVADIVESMSADRPYRPALGLAKAMLEIGRLSVSKLDMRVVEACVEVIKRGDYTPAELILPD